MMHLSHHRGQLTVDLRLNEVPMPSIYGAHGRRYAVCMIESGRVRSLQ